MLAGAQTRRTMSLLGFIADPRRTSRLAVLLLAISLVGLAAYRTLLPVTPAALSVETVPTQAASPVAHTKDFYYKLLRDKTKGELMGEWDTDLLVPLLAAFYTHQRLNKLIGKGNIFIDVGANTGWWESQHVVASEPAG